MQNSPNTATIDALDIKFALPEAVVLKPMAPGFTQRFNDSKAVWVCAEPSLFTESGNPDCSADWQARCGDIVALPAKPNTGNSKLTSLSGISCLAFLPRVNCGYCIPEATLGDEPFSLALIYAPSMENEPRSLATINPVEDENNYLFLSERENAIELTDKQGSFSLRQLVTPEHKGFRLVIFSRTEERYALALEGRIIRHQFPSVENLKEDETGFDISGISDLFIGCRSHRKGILKTLGEFLLADIFFWPNKDILASRKNELDAETSLEYDLLLNYYTEVISRDV